MTAGAGVRAEMMRKEKGEIKLTQAERAATINGPVLECIRSLRGIGQFPAWNQGKGMSGRSGKGN